MVNSWIQGQNVPIFNQTIPKEGPKAIRFSLDFQVVQQIELDLTTIVSMKQISFVQCLFVDNSMNPEPIYFVGINVEQNLLVPPYSQAYLPILVSDRPVFRIATTGGVIVPIHALNVPLPPCVWSVVSNANQYDGAGNLLVSDPALEALISAGGLNVNVIDGGAGGGLPTLSVQSNALAGNVNTNLVTGSPFYFLNALEIYLDGDAINAASGDTFFEGSVIESATGITIATVRGFVPKVAPTVLTQPQILLRQTGMNFWSTTSGGSLRWLNATFPALSGGKLRIRASYALGSP